MVKKLQLVISKDQVEELLQKKVKQIKEKIIKFVEINTIDDYFELKSETLIEWIKQVR